MSHLNKNAPVLVTGISGFVAAHVALNLLQHGYVVRGTVRSQSKADAVRAVPEFGPYQDKLQLTIIEDIATSDFTKALEGVEAIAHCASPFAMTSKGDNENEFLKPAIQGTTNIVRAAIKTGTVKNIVVTSSFASVMDCSDFDILSGRVYTEADWNPATYEEAVKSDQTVFVYCASKVLAEKAANEEIKKAGSSITISALNPPMVFGPHVHPTTLSTLNESSVQLWDVVGGKASPDLPPSGFPIFADVRDLAEAHTQALERNATGRFLVSNGNFDWPSVVELARSKFPEDATNLAQVKDSDRILNNPKLLKLDAKRSQDVLGLKYRTLEETIGDTVAQLYQWRREGRE